MRFKKTEKEVVGILLNLIPVFFMISLIDRIKDDFLLAGAFVAVIIVSLLIKYEKKDIHILVLGLVMMTIFEYIFIMAGAENFNRRSLFGIMPIWLPVLWSYGFVAIKRTVNILK